MNKQLAKTKKKKGFTLIELVVVIAILGILAAILIPVIGGFIERANISRDQANARNIFNSVAIITSTDGVIAELIDEFLDLSDATVAGYALDANGDPTSAFYGTQRYSSGGGFSDYEDTDGDVSLIAAAAP